MPLEMERGDSMLDDGLGVMLFHDAVMVYGASLSWLNVHPICWYPTSRHIRTVSTFILAL